MNIFRVHNDPIIAAQSLVDRHVVKMILESTQLLCTAHRFLDGKMVVVQNENGRKAKRWVLYDDRETRLYVATHINHPSAVWCRQSVENYLWLVEHLYALMDEYTYRYEKTHKCKEIAYYIQSPPNNLKEYDMTLIPCAMDDKYKISNDPVENYRNYYNIGKKDLHKWTKRQPPNWIIQ